MGNIRRLYLGMRVRAERHNPRELMQWCHHLLAQMNKLERLELEAAKVLSLPLMPRLKHLAISMDLALLPKAIASIAALPTLETLHVTRCNPGVYEYDEEITRSLCLSKCPRLRAVALVNLVPSSVMLPAATKLAVELDADDVFWAGLWLYTTVIKAGCSLRLTGSPASQMGSLRNWLDGAPHGSLPDKSAHANATAELCRVSAAAAILVA